MVNAGTSAVFTLSGTPNTDWDNRPSHNANTHLPYVQQKSNVARGCTAPEKDFIYLATKTPNWMSLLHFGKMISLMKSGEWKPAAGQRRRRLRGGAQKLHRVKSTALEPATIRTGKPWVFMVVGNSDMYGSFDAFEQKSFSPHTEKWYFNLPGPRNGSIIQKLQLSARRWNTPWTGDILSGPTRTTGIRNAVSEYKSIAVYPNPAKDALTLDLSSMMFKLLQHVCWTLQDRKSTANRLTKYWHLKNAVNRWLVGRCLFPTVNCEQEIHTQKKSSAIRRINTYFTKEILKGRWCLPFPLTHSLRAVKVY